MKKLVILIPLLLLTGCTLSSDLEKTCTKTIQAEISTDITYDIKFKKNQIYEIIKTTAYKSDNSNLLQTTLDSIEIESVNKTNDFVNYSLNGNVLTITYDVLNLEEDYNDIKKKYSDQKQYLLDLGYTCN